MNCSNQLAVIIRLPLSHNACPSVTRWAGICVFKRFRNFALVTYNLKLFEPFYLQFLLINVRKPIGSFLARHW